MPGLDISLIIGDALLFKYIGAKGQAGNRMSGAGRFRSSVRVHAVVCCPGLILCRYVFACIIDGQSIFIIHCCFILINRLSIFILPYLYGFDQYLISLIIHCVCQHTSIVIIDICHAGDGIRETQRIPFFIQHQQLSRIRVFPGIHLIQIIEIQIYRGIIHNDGIPHIPRGLMCFHGVTRTVFLTNHTYFLMSTGICIRNPRYPAVLDSSAYALIDMFPRFFNFYGMVQGQSCAGYGNVKADSPA